MEFIKGFDVSSLAEVERCGGKFYDGGAAEDAICILKRNGGNCLRLRLWMDPQDAAGMSYGAGHCNLETVLSLAKRGKAAGMEWLLCLHYSDFWTDPGKQRMPKAWCGFDETALVQAIDRYTREVLKACIDADVPPYMVQVGNELTKGMLWPVGETPHWDALMRFVKTGIAAVRETLPQAYVMVHLDNGGNQSMYREWFDHFYAAGGDCDVIGLSYYPFWHGTMDGLKDNLQMLSKRYDKDLIVVETSMGFTLEDYSAHEGLSASERRGPAAKPPLTDHLAWDMTPEGQTVFLRELFTVMRSIPHDHGKGIFWWEPAWIPVHGSQWATEAGWQYIGEKGPGGNEWANQALFDFDGHALPALKVFQEH